MSAVVWVDGWQQECCGEPFAVGGTVTWSVNRADLRWYTGALGRELAERLDYTEEHHDGPTVRTLEGTVRGIEAVYCAYGPPEPGTRLTRPLAGSTQAHAIAESSLVVGRKGSADFTGYVVTVEET